MSHHDSPHDHDCLADAAAYVLGALEPQEAAAFRRHLETCVICRDELSTFGAVTSVLPLAAPPQPVPRAVKRRMMAAIRAEQRMSQRQNAEQAPRRPRFMLTRPMASALAGSVAVLAALAIVLSGSGSSSSASRLIHATTAWQATGGNAILKVSGGHAELIVNRAPAPPAGQVYEVWIKRPAQPPVATNVLFGVTASGAGNVDVPGNLRGARQVMVTVEPAGGSREPTHPPVVVAKLS